MQFCALASVIAGVVSISSFFSTLPVILQAACALAALTHPSHLLE
ncbi:methionine aminopeptidase [Pectobacterium carotovorum subsp. carotovorum]|nr:methionine aminopeptidase [Pectobacterium carotovorum subsp. carotovorum]